MAKVRLSEAARRVGIARSTLYEKYINAGKITVETELFDGRERKVIDLAELHRVFGDKPSLSDADNSETVRGVHTRRTEDGQEYNTLQATVEVLQEQLRAAAERERAHQEREKWYQGQMESLANSIKLLEHRGAADPLPVVPRRGFFGRLFGGGK